ncbi:MAG: hypothetical protein QOE61_4032, partial [Micromonosporaceae bacterium]|nr:hypothetical protein [Micromonosporaceae bacterium]
GLVRAKAGVACCYVTRRGRGQDTPRIGPAPPVVVRESKITGNTSGVTGGGVRNDSNRRIEDSKVNHNQTQESCVDVGYTLPCRGQHGVARAARDVEHLLARVDVQRADQQLADHDLGHADAVDVSRGSGPLLPGGDRGEVVSHCELRSVDGAVPIGPSGHCDGQRSVVAVGLVLVESNVDPSLRVARQHG